MPANAALATLVRVRRLDEDPRTLLEMRRVLGVPPWAQLATVTGLFVASVLLSAHEFRTRGTAFGFAGPGFNAIVCPIYEELIFRGWILGRLAHRRPAWQAILVSSALFGILHLRLIYWLEPPALARTMAWSGLVLGPLFGWVTLRTRSVWPAVMLHYANNLAYYLRH